MATQPAPQQLHSTQELRRRIAAVRTANLRATAELLTVAANSHCTGVDFDDCLQLVRAQRLFTNHELAQLAGYTLPALHNWQRTQRWPEPERLRAILHAWARRLRQMALPEAARAAAA